MIEDKFNKIELTSAQLFDLIQKYLEDCDEKVSTVRARQCGLNFFYNYHLKRESFYFIPEDIELYKFYLLQKSELSKHSIRNYFSTLKLFCDYLAQCCVIDKNPVRRVDFKLKADEVNLRYIKYNDLISICEFDKIEITNDFRKIRNQIIPLILIFTGISETELLNLKLNSLNKKNKYYYLQTNSEEIKIDGNIKNCIKNYLNLRYSIEAEDYLFITYGRVSQGKQLSYRNLREITNSFVKNNGFDGSPTRIIANTTILLNYKINKNMNTFNKFNIRNKNIIQRYLDVFPEFIK